MYRNNSCTRWGGDLHAVVLSSRYHSGVLFYIWNKAPHYAFIDIFLYGNYYYSTFRERRKYDSTNWSDYGKNRISKSLDGKLWNSTEITDKQGFDMSGLCLSIIPNRIRFLNAKSSVDNGKNKEILTRTRAFFTTNFLVGVLSYYNSFDLTSHRRCLWKVTWHKSIVYGVACSAGQISISVKSSNGTCFEQICEYKELINAKNNKVDLIFISSNGYYGKSLSPCSKWSWKPLNYQIYSLKLFYIALELFVVKRGSSGHTDLFHMKDDAKLKPIYMLPEGWNIDCSEVIKKGDKLWISYYATAIQISVYLLKISVASIFNRIDVY